MEQGALRTFIGEIMTTSALLAGFTMGAIGKINTAEIRTYAEFLKAEYFGAHSHFCEFVVEDPPEGFTGITNGAGVAGGERCDANGCWVEA